MKIISERRPSFRRKSRSDSAGSGMSRRDLVEHLGSLRDLNNPDFVDAKDRKFMEQCTSKMAQLVYDSQFLSDVGSREGEQRGASVVLEEAAFEAPPSNKALENVLSEIFYGLRISM